MTRSAVLALALAAAACDGGGGGGGDDAVEPTGALEPGGWTLERKTSSGGAGETGTRWYIDGASGYLDFVWAAGLDSNVYWACQGTIDAAAIGELTEVMNELDVLTAPGDDDLGVATYVVLATTGEAAGAVNGFGDDADARGDLRGAMLAIAAQTGCTIPP